MDFVLMHIMDDLIPLKQPDDRTSTWCPKNLITITTHETAKEAYLS